MTDKMFSTLILMVIGTLLVVFLTVVFTRLYESDYFLERRAYKCLAEGGDFVELRKFSRTFICVPRKPKQNQ